MDLFENDKLSKSQRRRSRKKLRKEDPLPVEDVDDHLEITSAQADALVHPENAAASTFDSPLQKKKKHRQKSGENRKPSIPPNDDLKNVEEPPAPDVERHIVPSPKLSRKARQKAKKKLKNAAGAAVDSPVNVVRDDLQPDASSSTSETVPEFTIIGEQKPVKKVRLPPFLPSWYSSPIPIASGLKDSLMPVEELAGLDPSFLPLLRDQGIDKFFPVQIAIIPEIIGYQNFQRYYTNRPHDLCVCAPTGSGKTLAYVLPILQDLKHRTTRKIRALVLLPVKELAVQVAEVFQTFSKESSVKIALICGRQSLEQERQQFFKVDPSMKYLSDALPNLMENFKIKDECAVDVVVATPGRLVEHLYETEGLDFSTLEYLVVDEADRMIEEFKNNWFRLLERSIFRDPVKRSALQHNCVAELEKPTLPLQKLLFSATLSYDPQRFETLKLYRPKLFSVVPSESDQDILMRNDAEVIGTYVTPEELKEFSTLTDPRLKPLVLLHLLHNLGWNRVLVFTNSLENTHRLYLLLKLFDGKRKINVKEISSNVHQRKRQANLDGFEKGNVDVLVASDSMARGIDLSNVQYVVLYDAPFHAKTYIHRCGRTARAGKPGTTLTLLKPNEKKGFERMMKELKKKFPEKLSVAPSELADLEESYKNALQKLEVEINLHN